MIAIQEYHFNIYFETRPAGCQSSWSAQREKRIATLHSTPLALPLGRASARSGKQPCRDAQRTRTSKGIQTKGFCGHLVPFVPSLCQARTPCLVPGVPGMPCARISWLYSRRLHPAIPTKAGLAREHGKRCGCFMPHETPSSPERNGSHSDWRIRGFVMDMSTRGRRRTAAAGRPLELSRGVGAARLALRRLRLALPANGEFWHLRTHTRVNARSVGGERCLSHSMRSDRRTTLPERPYTGSL